MHFLNTAIQPWQADSVKRIRNDFAQEGKPLYAAAHIYFTSHVEDEVLFIIKTVQCIFTSRNLHHTFSLACSGSGSTKASLIQANLLSETKLDFDVHETRKHETSIPEPENRCAWCMFTPFQNLEEAAHFRACFLSVLVLCIR